MAKTPSLLLEAVFVLETVADSRWHVDRFLAPTPVRVLVDFGGNDLTAARGAAGIAADFADATIQRFLERPAFNPALLKTLLDFATARAEEQSAGLKGAARAKAAAALTADLQRLVDLQKINDHVRPGEIALAREQLQHTDAAIEQARLRLDSLRLIVESPKGGV